MESYLLVFSSMGCVNLGGSLQIFFSLYFLYFKVLFFSIFPVFQVSVFRFNSPRIYFYV